MIRNTVKTALAILRRNPFFTGVSLFAISFTLAVLMTAVSLLDGLFNPAGPRQGNHGLAMIGYAEMWGEGNHWNGNPGYRLLREIVPDLPGVSQSTLYTDDGKAITWQEGARLERALKHTDESFWQVLNFEFLEGRPYTAEDLERAEPVLVINESTRDLLFPDGALGRVLELDNVHFRVIGVVRDVSQMDRWSYAEAWAPLTTLKDASYKDNWMGSFRGVIQLDGSLPFEAVRQELYRRCGEIEIGGDGSYQQILATVFSSELERMAHEMFRTNEPGDTNSYGARLSSVLLGAALLFMALPALNLVNLNLSRVLERGSEIGVRRAFGATSGVLILQLLVENLVLVVIGALIAVGGHALLLRIIENSGLLAYIELGWNGRVFGIALAMVLVFSVLSGILPAWRISRLHPVQTLKGVR